jgi:hypothetical protein
MSMLSQENCKKNLPRYVRIGMRIPKKIVSEEEQLLYKVKRWHESDKFVAKDASQYERE